MNHKYIGCIGIKTSYRSIFYARMKQDIVKESINRLCKANKIHREIEGNCSEDIGKNISDTPNLRYSGSDAKLCVTETHLIILANDTKKALIRHELQNVSFASSGDNNTDDFVAYVAKDEIFGRACFVLEYRDGTAKEALDQIANAFKIRSDLMKTMSELSSDKSTLSNTMFLSDSPEATIDTSRKSCLSEFNNRNENVVARTRALLDREPWYHGSYISRELSETRLKEDGDFLVRESSVEPGQFVLSVMHDGTKLHLLFDSIGKVKTKDRTFENISHLVKSHYGEELPILAENREIYLRKGVPPPPRNHSKFDSY